MFNLRSWPASASLAASALLLTAAVQAGELTDSLKPGKAALQSAGALAFGPEGVLFVGDSRGGSVWALATGDTTKASAMEAIDIANLGKKVADKLAIPTADLLINDLAVNPLSGTAYLSVSRGKGPDAQPVIFQISKGDVKELTLDNIAHAKADLPALPAAAGRNQALRNDAITDLAFLDGKLYVAGLSNEDFSSSLSSLPAKGLRLKFIMVLMGDMRPSRQFVPLSPIVLPASRTCSPLIPAHHWSKFL